MKRDFLTLKSVSSDELKFLIRRARELKSHVKNGTCPKPLQGKVLGLIFEKSSTRTRVSFEVAVLHLGGFGIYLNQSMSQLGRGESYADTARVLSGYVNGMVLRTFSQTGLEELASYATVPVINGLTDEHHPCQLVADLLTLSEHFSDLSKLKIAYVGDGNNMTRSWIEAAELLGFELRIASPKGFEVAEAHTLKSPKIIFTNSPQDAVKDCDAINTDTWFSMGQETTDEKRQAFEPFQVNKKMLSLAKPGALVMHCLPAHRGEEITNEVMDGPQSVVFQEAENRLYAHMAILEMLMG